MSNWTEVEYSSDKDYSALRKSFKFDGFKQALEFVNKVGQLAESANHHPDIKFGWGFVEITLTTHSEKQITQKDYNLAKSIDCL